jgi:hypothetical protein
MTYDLIEDSGTRIAIAVRDKFRIQMATTTHLTREPNMNPLSSNIGSRRRFPVTDCSYYSHDFFELKAGCGRLFPASFVAISRDYLNREARHDFVIEAVTFALITVTTVPALFDCGRAVVQFLRIIGGI